MRHEPETSHSTGGDRMATILIVDDQLESLQMFSLVLRRWGYQARTAMSGEEALEALKDQDVDLVILDYMMPGLDGFETLERIRKLPFGKDLPVIMVTAYGNEGIRKRAEEMGLDGFFMKPVDLQMFSELIKVILGSQVPIR